MRCINVPIGTKNIKNWHPSIIMEDVAEYFIEMVDSSDTVLASSSSYFVKPNHEHCIRLHFFNAMGAIDAINFDLVDSELTSTSQDIKSPLIYPLSKPEHEVKRFNIEANETYTVRSDEYPEEAMTWLRELITTSTLWLEWKGVQGQVDSYLPVVLVDNPILVKKHFDSFLYIVELKFKLSHTYKSQR